MELGPLSLPTSMVQIVSYVHSVHTYKHICEPKEGQVLPLKHEQDNTEDKFVVVVVKSGAVVGHVPKKIAPVVSQFLNRDCNKGVARITGKRINRGGGYGLEAPCKFCLYGPEPYLRRLRDVVDAAGEAVSEITTGDPETRSQPDWTLAFMKP